jgi:hypothetical protein
MPIKGMYTQCVCVLLTQAPELSAVESAVSNFEVVARKEHSDNWVFSGPSLILPYRPEVNGYIQIDVVNRPWPDHMGDSKREPELLAAWGMACFGPFAYPGGLQRAMQHSYSWADGKTRPNEHQAFIRVRTSYVFGAEQNAPIMPSDYAPLPELRRVTEISQALLSLPGSLCYFNPNGEALHDRTSMGESLTYHNSQNLPPLDVWSNVRIFKLEGGRTAWTMMDTVGLGQLDVDDHEACFESGRYIPDQIVNFLRNASDYVMKHGPVIRDGDTMNGPGKQNWQARRMNRGLVDPPRHVLRWFPQDRSKPPAALLEDRK